MTRALWPFGSKKILVLGDVMLDRYITGTVSRISPEAPVPVLHVTEEQDVPGGAANVALALAALGASVSLCGVVGDDGNGERLLRLLEEVGIQTTGILQDAQRKTTVKSRVVSQSQQLLRVDREETGHIDPNAAGALLQRLQEELAEADAVLFSDYGKGVITPELFLAVRDAARQEGCLVTADPTIKNFLLYKNVDLLTPNNREAGEGIAIPITGEDSLRLAGGAIMERLSPGMLLITRSEAGVALFLPQQELLEIPTVAREVFDVTGAGDVVIAVATLALTVGLAPAEAARLANAAAGLAVGHFGCHPVTARELADAFTG